MKLIKNHSVKSKITVITITITIITAIITITVCSFVFQSLLKKNLIQSTEFGVRMAVDSVTEKMNNIMALNDWANYSTQITSYLSKGEDCSNALKLEAYNRFTEEYHNNKSNDYINRLMIADNNGMYMQILKNVIEGSSNDYAAITRLDYFSTLLSYPKFKWIGLVEENTRSRGQTIIPLVRPIYSAYNSNIIGFIYISVSSNLILDALNNYTVPSEKNVYFTMGDITYELTDSHLTPISLPYSISKELKNQNVYEGTVISEALDSKGKSCTVITCPSKINGWSVSQVLSETLFSVQRITYLLVLVFICIIICALGYLMTVFLNITITEPVHNILKKVAAISKGDFSQAAEIETDDEFGEIGHGINKLSKNVVALMDKRVDAEKQQRELEYQILLSQINPHFLYNTLNSIKWMATVQNATGIAEMTTALSRLLKNVSKNLKQMITVKEELNLLKDYTTILEYRYGGVITIKYDIDESVLDSVIPKFSLQPLVENAIFHGIEAKGSSGTISISIQKKDENLSIVVEDDGVGMSEELIKQILSGTEQTNTDLFQKVGIANVNKRLQYAYSTLTNNSDGTPAPDVRYGLTIESVIGEYTCMRILVPIKKETEESSCTN